MLTSTSTRAPNAAATPPSESGGSVATGSETMPSQTQTNTLTPTPSTPAKLEDQEWYHGLLPREDIVRMLRKQGDFIVRKSEVDGKIKYILSICWEKKTKHVIIHVGANGRYLIDPNDKDFPTITELVEHYWKKQVTIPRTKYTLINPVPRQEWELKHEDIILSKKLGEGAFGEVFKGELVKHNKEKVPVAVKRSHANQELTKEQINELIAEVRIMQKFKHENVVRLYGVAAEIQPIMIVMELASGGSLDSYLKKYGSSLNHLDKTRFALDSAKGMAYLHEQTCLHRDLAARNCLITGETGIVKIADFGLSSLGGFYKMQAAQKVPVKWLAPETMRRGYYDYKTDVWSYGIMVWEIFMDASDPYPGMKVAEVQQAVGRMKYRMHVPPEWPAQVRSVIDLCWQEDADKRPSFARLAEMLLQATRELERAARLHK